MCATCDITINNTDEGVFKAGQTVSGVVKYFVDQPTEYKSIILSLIGKAECEFKRTGFGPDLQTQIIYEHGDESFVNRWINILQNREGQTITLPKGTYEHPFEFILPMNVPTSYKHKAHMLSDYSCNVSYFVQMQFDYPSFFSRNKIIEKEVIVYGNVNPIAPHEPILYGLEKSLIKPFCDTLDKVSLKTEILKSFISPGENVSLNIHIDNNTDVQVSIEVKLIRKTTLTSRNDQQKSVEKDVLDTSRKTTGINQFSQAGVSIKVPTRPDLYSIQHLKTIIVDYIVRVTILLPMPFINPHLDIPIVIGEGNVNQTRILDLNDYAVDDIDDEMPPSYYECL